jgi:hypothetical protein
MGKTMRAYVYRTCVTKESRKSWGHVTQRYCRAHRGDGACATCAWQTVTATDIHGSQESTISPATQPIKKHVKDRQRRCLTA